MIETEQIIQERRRNPPDRRTYCGRFASHLGTKHLQVILDPKLVFLNDCPQYLQEAYERIRSMNDEFMVNIADEAAKLDGIQAKDGSMNLSDGRRRFKC